MAYPLNFSVDEAGCGGEERWGGLDGPQTHGFCAGLRRGARQFCCGSAAGDAGLASVARVWGGAGGQAAADARWEQAAAQFGCSRAISSLPST